MRIRDRLEEIKGKNIRVDSSYSGIVIDSHGSLKITEIGDDCFRLNDGSVIPFTAITIIKGDI